MIGTFTGIAKRARKDEGKKRLAVPSPNKQEIELLCKAATKMPVIPLLVGDGKAIRATLKKSPLASMEHEIINARGAGEALRAAIRLAREDRADILMQGGEDQKTFIQAALNVKTGLLKDKVASYPSVVQLQKRNKLIIVTDTLVNNSPGIVEKQLILEHALGLADILGIKEPKVAVLAAIEQVNPSIPSTVDAAVLAKMADRKQFGKAIVEGPLDMDCAVSCVAAKRKGIMSVVTGNADIFLVPCIETGYSLIEALVFWGKMKTAGILMGTTKPVALNPPFISDENRLVEIAIATLISARGMKHG
jgi:phosphate butyryltransferase